MENRNTMKTGYVAKLHANIAPRDWLVPDFGWNAFDLLDNGASVSDAVKHALTVDFMRARRTQDSDIGAKFESNLLSYVSDVTADGIANLARIARVKGDRAILETYAHTVVHPRTGRCANLYSVEKLCQLTAAATKEGFDAFRVDRHTAAIVANLSRYDFALTMEQMKAIDAFESTDCPRAWRETLSKGTRVRQGYGKSTASTQVSSTCMALAAFGFAQYDGKRLTVRETDRVVRALAKVYDAMSADTLKSVLHHSAHVTYSPLGASVTTE